MTVRPSSRVVRAAALAKRLLLFGVAGVNLCQFTDPAVLGTGIVKTRWMALKSEAGLGIAGLW
jgi:hypothetical protein